MATFRTEAADKWAEAQAALQAIRDANPALAIEVIPIIPGAYRVEVTRATTHDTFLVLDDELNERLDALCGQ